MVHFKRRAPSHGFQGTNAVVVDITNVYLRAELVDQLRPDTRSYFTYNPKAPRTQSFNIASHFLGSRLQGVGFVFDDVEAEPLHFVKEFFLFAFGSGYFEGKPANLHVDPGICGTKLSFP